MNMVSILMSLLKIKVFSKKYYDAKISVKEVDKKFYQATQIILLMWFCEQDLVTLAFL